MRSVEKVDGAIAEFPGLYLGHKTIEVNTDPNTNVSILDEAPPVIQIRYSFPVLPSVAIPVFLKHQKH